MYRKFLTVRVLGLGSILLFVLGVCLYLLLGKSSKSLVVQKLLIRQETLTKAQTSNIESFFQVFGDSIGLLAQSDNILNQDEGALEYMDTFVDQWSYTNLLGGIILTDKNGVVKYNSNITGIKDVGASLADRDYFIWAKTNSNKGEYFIGDVIISRLGASKGQAIVVVASPIYKNNTFQGVFAASIKLDSLTHNFLEIIKVADTTDVYLISSGGDLLYSNNFSEQLFEQILNLKKVDSESSLKLGDHLVAYSTVDTGGQKWLLVTASPIEEVWSVLTPFYIRVFVLAALIFITTVWLQSRFLNSKS